MQLFSLAYGAEAGNLALKLLPLWCGLRCRRHRSKILPLIQEGSFYKPLLKGRVSSLLKSIPALS